MLEGVIAEFSLPRPKPYCLSVLWLCLEAPAETQVVVVLGAIHKCAPDDTLVRGGTRLMHICKLFFSIYHHPRPTHTFFGENVPVACPPRSQMRTIKIAWLCGSRWSCCSEQVQTDRAIAIATEVMCEIPGNRSSSSSPTHSGPFSDFSPFFFCVVFPKVPVSIHALSWIPREMLCKQPIGLR